MKDTVMTVNVGTVGHIDHGKDILIVGAGNSKLGALGKTILLGGAALGPSFLKQVSDMIPEPKPPKQMTDTDHTRIREAEMKRMRRATKRKGN
jgi:hypothetical protein